MSDIPHARVILRQALNASRHDMREAIGLALKLMVRRRPDFRAHTELAPLSPKQKEIAREMRAQGYSLNHIMRTLSTNIGRVSEAINE